MAFSDLVANQTQRVGVVIRIDGVGINSVTSAQLTALNSDARVRFCSSVPAYADSTVLDWYKPVLMEMPNELSLRGDPLGGIPKQASLSFSLMDDGDWLTSNLRVDGPATDSLASSATASSSVTVQDDTNFSVNDIIWIGTEAMRVTAKPGSNVLTVTRGVLGTTATAHDQYAEVFRYTNFLRGRFVTMSLVDLDASAESEEVDVGTWMIDGMSWGSNMNEFTFSCSSRLRSVGRLVPKVNFDTLTVSAGVDEDLEGSGELGVIENDLIQDHQDDGYGYLYIEGEVIEWYASSGKLPNKFVPKMRGICGTKVREIKAGDTGVRVYVADPKVNAPSFRWSDPRLGAVATTRTGNWSTTQHFVDIILNIATSGNESDTIADADFYSSTYGNWAQLEAGMGAGIKLTDIDIENWIEIKQRTPTFLFPNFFFGHEPRSFGELIEEEFMKPIGAYFGIDRTTGKITIVLPRMPNAADSVLTVGTDEILCREVGASAYEPDIELEYPLESVAGAVAFRAGPNKKQVRFRQNDAIAQYNKEFRGEAESIVIDVPSADEDETLWLQQIAMGRLFRMHRPQLRATMSVSLAAYASSIGSIWSVTYPEAPNLADGTRGRSGVLSQLISTSIKFDERGAYVGAQLIGYVNRVKVGVIAPTGDISSVLGADQVRISTNTYTAGTVFGSLPDADAEAFEVGDVVDLYSSRGAYIGGPLTISAISNNDITFETGHGQTFTTAYYIRLANYDNSSTDAKAEHAFMGNRSTHSVTTGGDLYVWGEP